MKKYLIAIDIDGTSVNGKGEMSDFTIDTLKKVHLLGHEVAIVTGRSWLGVKKIYDSIGLLTPICVYNGGYVFHPHTGEVFHSRPIKKDFIIDFSKSKEAEELLANIVLEYYDTTYLRFPNAHNKISSEKLKIGDFAETLDRDPISFVLQMKQGANHELIKKHFEKISKIFSYRYWGEGFLFGEVYYNDLSKRDGIIAIAKELKFDNENIIFYGDGLNDVEILEHVGLGIAMKNASDEVKNYAKTETEYSNDENGVALDLIKRFNIK